MAQTPTLNGNMPNSSKKRKSMDTDQNDNSPGPKTTKKRAKNKRKSIAPVDEIPFTTECPLKRVPEEDDIYIHDEILAEGFSFDFAVRPGSRWRHMRSYRHVKYAENTFSIGDVIYINRSLPPPKPPPDNASDEEVLAYDRRNFWVARIADTRAANASAVYLRVFWLYWPEELPMGRQPYHTDNELVLSNAMDIVDAQTISSHAEVRRWDDSDVEAKIPDRFWRQTLDIGQLGKNNNGGLSALKAHCVCQQPYNPAKNMYQCTDLSCGTWNHEECLIGDAKARVRTLHQNNRLDEADFSTIKTEESTDSHRFLSPLRDLGKFVQNKVLPAMNATPERTVKSEMNGSAETDNSLTVPVSRPSAATTPRKRGRPPKVASHSHDLNHDKFQITLVGFETNEGPLIAKVEELADTAGKKKVKPETTGRTWDIRVNCLKCGKAMD